MSLDTLSFMPDFCEAVAEETKRCHHLYGEGKSITHDKIKAVTLADYRQACQSLGKDVLTDALLQEQLTYFKERMHEMRELFMSGMKIMLTIFPCDSSGVKYNDDAVKNNFYFHILREEKSSGLHLGYANSVATTHGIMLPKEIQEQCSFIVEFKLPALEHQPLSINEKDWPDFERKFSKAFINLRTLLNITHAA